MEKLIEIITKPETLAVLLLVASVALFAAKLAVKALGAHAKTTPGDTDDKAVAVAGAVVDAASAAVDAAKAARGLKK